MKYVPSYKSILIILLIFGSKLAIAQTTICPGEPIHISVIDNDTLTYEPTLDTITVNPGPPSGDGDKIIFWVHGLGGSVESWERAAVATQFGGESPEWSAKPQHAGWVARKAFCERPKYTELSIGGASATLHNKMLPFKTLNLQFETDPKQNFIIAHSQGGLVSRHLWKRYAEDNSTIAEEDQMFGGIVTFGTAHQGAQIVNNTVPADEGGPDLGVAFATDACIELGIGPVLEAVETNFFLDIFSNRGGIETSLSGACAGLSGLAVPIALADFTAGITEDYMVGSSTIDALNANDEAHPLPRVTFYGIEDDTDRDLVWRIMSSLSGNHDSPNQFATFEADEDGTLMQEVIEMLADYIAKEEAWAMKADHYRDRSFGIVPCNGWDWTFFSPICALYDGRYYEAISISDSYQRGVNWFTSANTKYQIITGGVQVKPVPAFTCDCGGAQLYDVIDPNFCTNLGCTPVENGIKFVLERRRSDGIVLEESASNYPGAQYSIPLFGSNHQQMRNDGNAERVLLKLFGSGYGNFFETFEKQ